jgi:hypothetical protein
MYVKWEVKKFSIPVIRVVVYYLGEMENNLISSLTQKLKGEFAWREKLCKREGGKEKGVKMFYN